MSDSGGVSKDVDIRLIDPQKLDEEAQRLVEAQKLANEKKKIEDELKNVPNSKIDEIKQLVQQHQALQKSLTSGVGPLAHLPQSNQAPGSSGPPGGGYSGPGSSSPLGNLNAYKAKVHKVLDPEDTEGKVEEAWDTAKQLAENPAGFLQNKLLQSLGKLGVYGMAAQFGIETVQEIFELWKAQFGAGGTMDMTKPVLDRVKTIPSLQTIIRIADGEVYFTDDAGMRLKQRAPQNSNTRELVSGHRVSNYLGIGK